MSVSAPLRMLVIAQFSPRKIWSSGYHGTVYAGVGVGRNWSHHHCLENKYRKISPRSKSMFGLQN